MDINYDTVDLGLPSGLKWAKCNLGAKKESDCGLYFQWGSTKGYAKKEIEKIWYKNVPYCDESTHTYVKYNPCFDKKKILDKYDDAISKIMGLNYRMPTKEDFDELLNYTTNEWVTNYKDSGVNGRLFTSKTNNNTLFIPASGYAYGGSVFSVGSDLYVWSSSLNTSNPFNAWYLRGRLSSSYMSDIYRRYGFSLRGVINC